MISAFLRVARSSTLELDDLLRRPPKNAPLARLSTGRPGAALGQHRAFQPCVPALPPATYEVDFGRMYEASRCDPDESQIEPGPLVGGKTTTIRSKAKTAVLATEATEVTEERREEGLTRRRSENPVFWSLHLRSSLCFSVTSVASFLSFLPGR